MLELVFVGSGPVTREAQAWLDRANEMIREQLREDMAQFVERGYVEIRIPNEPCPA